MLPSERIEHRLSTDQGVEIGARSPEFELDVVHYLRHGGVGFYTLKAGRAAEPLARRNGVASPQAALLRPLSFPNRR